MLVLYAVSKILTQQLRATLEILQSNPYNYITIECSEINTFLCTESLVNDPICVNELQLCDGVSDCPNGSDESENCGTGKD